MTFMTKLFLSALFALLSVASYAAEAMASKESIEKLLAVSNARGSLDAISAQLDQYMQNSMKQALQGKTPTAEQQKAIDVMRTKFVAIMREELNWDSLEKLYVDIYHDTFTQAEVDGMIQFYQTPAGAAMVKKLPIAMQKSMAAVQQRMPALIAKLQQAAKEAQTELQKAPSAPANP